MYIYIYTYMYIYMCHRRVDGDLGEGRRDVQIIHVYTCILRIILLVYTDYLYIYIYTSIHMYTTDNNTSIHMYTTNNTYVYIYMNR